MIPPIDIVNLETASDRLTTDAGRRYESVVSIGAHYDEKPYGFDSYRGRKLRLVFDDWNHPHIFFTAGQSPAECLKNKGWAQPKQIEDLLAFFEDVQGPMLIHCNAGWSRSPAATLLFLVSRLGVGKEEEALKKLYEIKEGITPNTWVVTLGDLILGCDGRLFEVFTEKTELTKYPEPMRTIDYARAYLRHMRGDRTF